MTGPPVAAGLAVAVLGALAALQALVALGRPYGRYVWGGAHTVLPTRLRIGSAVSIVVYAVFALVLLDRSGVVSVVDDAVSGAATWVLAAYFGLGILMNAVSRSPAERAWMTPACVVLAVCSAVIALC